MLLTKLGLDRYARFGLLWLSLAACAACADDTAPPAPFTAATPPPKPAAPATYANWPNTLATFPRGADQTQRVCDRAADDRVHDAFCKGPPLAPASLTELQAAFGVSSDTITGFTQANPTRFAGLAANGHSTGLSARSVSAINPRVIVSFIDLLTRELGALAFTRGEQFVEMVTRDRSSEMGLHFYLLGFRQACNQEADGCKPADLLTPAAESGWQESTLYDETDVQNTVLDCAPCHQPKGPDTPKMLRMQELDSPWTHWFSEKNVGGRALLADYRAAKGDEPLAGMTGAQIAAADPQAVGTLVALIDPMQPNEFESTRIENEVTTSAAALGGRQPEDNSIAGQSATWRAAFDSAERGESITVPYHDVKVTDPGKLARMTEAYQAVAQGTSDPAELPDIRDVFLDDPQRQAELGFTPEPSLDGHATLLSACSPCHSALLDHSLSRARFRPELEWLTRREKDLAIARLMLPPDNPLAMPPARMRYLSVEARQRAIEALQE